MNGYMIKVLPAVLAGAVLVAAIKMLPQPRPADPPASVSGGYKTLLARESWCFWAHLNRVPESWFGVPDIAEGTMTLASPPGEFEPGHVPPTATVKIDLSSGDLCEGRCNFGPEYVTETIYLSGRPGVLYRGPTERLEGYYTSNHFVAVDERNDSEQSRNISFSVYYARSEQQHDQLISEIRSVLENTYFVPCYTDDLDWDNTEIDQPRIPGIPHIQITHPRGATVLETDRDVTVRANVPGIGPIGVVFEPFRPRAEWDNASQIFDEALLRQIGSSVEGSTRTTQYVRDWGNDPPIRMTTTTPDLPFGSEQYWKAEQTVWMIMLNFSISYDKSYP